MTWTREDLTNYGDEALDQLRLAVLDEQERRQRLALAPAMAADMTRRFIEDGGDPADLTAAIETAAAPPVEQPAADEATASAEDDESVKAEQAY